MSNAYDASTASIVGVKTSWETTSRQPTAGEARGGRLFSKSTTRFPLTSKDLEAFCIILSYISFLYEMSLSFLIDQICSKSKLLFETHPSFCLKTFVINFGGLIIIINLIEAQI